MDNNDLPKEKLLHVLTVHVNMSRRNVETCFSEARASILLNDDDLEVGVFKLMNFNDSVNAYYDAYKLFYAVRRFFGLKSKIKHIEDGLSAVEFMTKEIDRLVDPRTP